MKKLLFALLCLGLICVSCVKDNEQDSEIEYPENPDGGGERPIVFPKDTITYNNKVSYGCYYVFIENSTHTLSFRTDFEYEIVIETENLYWERIKKALDTKSNILEYEVI